MQWYIICRSKLCASAVNAGRAERNSRRKRFWNPAAATDFCRETHLSAKRRAHAPAGRQGVRQITAAFKLLSAPTLQKAQASLRTLRASPQERAG